MLMLLVCGPQFENYWLGTWLQHIVSTLQLCSMNIIIHSYIYECHLQHAL